MAKDKTFQYVQTKRTIDENNSNFDPDPSAGTPGKTRSASSTSEDAIAKRKKKWGVVRVKEGDKCVPPSKSRPKERTPIGPHDDNTLNMDSVEWTDKDFSVLEIITQFGDIFPLLVKVTEGYDGPIWPNLKTGQVLQVHSHGEQKRVHAKDSDNRLFSMPIDFPLDLHIMETNDRVWMKLVDVLHTRTMPLRTKVMNLTDEASVTFSILLGQELVLKDLHSCIFLRANIINDGWINQMEVALIPELKVRFSVAKSMRFASDEEWTEFQKMYSRSVRHLDFSIVAGYTGIYLQSPDGTCTPMIGDQLSTNNSKYSQMMMFSTTPQTHQPQQNPQPAEISFPKYFGKHLFLTSDPTYGNVNQAFEPDILITNVPQHSRENKGYGLSNADEELINVEQLSSGSISYAFNKKQERNSMEGKSPQITRSSTPFSEDEDDVETMFQKVIKVGKSTLERESGAHSKSIYTSVVKVNITDPTSFELFPVSSANSTDPHSKDKNTSIPNHNSESKTIPQSSTLNSHENFRNPLPSSDHSQDPQCTNYNAAQVKADNTPTCIILPMLFHQDTPPIGNLVCSRDDGDAKKGIHCMADVPNSLTDLSVEEVGQCLTLLHMENHVEDFRRHLIDGNLLADLKEKFLISEFRLTPFNASKLMRFVRGWRPNTT